MEWNGSGDSIGFWTIKGDASILSHGLNSVQGLLNLFISVGRVCPCNSSPGSEKGIYSNSRSHNSPIWGRGEIRKLATWFSLVFSGLKYLWDFQPTHVMHGLFIILLLSLFLFWHLIYLSYFPRVPLCTVSLNLARKRINLAFLIRSVHLPVANILLCISPWKALSTAPTKAGHKHGRPSKTPLNWTEVPVSPQN